MNVINDSNLVGIVLFSFSSLFCRLTGIQWKNWIRVNFRCVQRVMLTNSSCVDEAWVDPTNGAFVHESWIAGARNEEREVRCLFSLPTEFAQKKKASGPVHWKRYSLFSFFFFLVH